MRGAVRWSSLLMSFALLSMGGDARGFSHIVRAGETAAQIAEQMYGRVELESVIVAANGLGGSTGSVLVPGMRLEIPALGHHRVVPGDTWQALADTYLGGEHRAVVLADVNGSKPWVPPDIGREVMLPYNLRYLATDGDTTQTVAYRFLGKRQQSWVVASYNDMKRVKLRQGEVLLVPLVDLELTAVGREAARQAGALLRGEAGGQTRGVQRSAEREIPRLVLDVRHGRYLEAVRRGAALGAELLSQAQEAVIYEQLTVAYVALDASGLAQDACTRWGQADPERVLDPVEHSPKILRACVGEGAGPSTVSPGPASPVSSGPASPGEGDVGAGAR